MQMKLALGRQLMGLLHQRLRDDVKGAKLFQEHLLPGSLGATA